VEEEEEEEVAYLWSYRPEVPLVVGDRPVTRMRNPSREREKNKKGKKSLNASVTWRGGPFFWAA
jgi:hypothetical protein